MVRKIVLQLLVVLAHNAVGGYWSERERIIEKEESEAVGASIQLTMKEMIANNILMGYKLSELNVGLRNTSAYLPEKHFYESKPLIDKSPVFEIIRMIPKGASLHSHITASSSGEYLYNLTYRSGLYACVMDDKLHLHFYPAHKSHEDWNCTWELVSTLRQENASFDAYLKSQLSSVVNNTAEYPYVDDSAWTNFRNSFAATKGLLKYKDVYEEYLYQVMKEMHEDNVMYMELRSGSSNIYDLKGNDYGISTQLELCKHVSMKFQKDHPDFLGIKIIYTGNRLMNDLTSYKYALTAVELKSKFPDLIAGVDLADRETIGGPLKNFVPLLRSISDKVRFYFHAGETNWNGMHADLNLVDAVLLNASRIGHSFALLKHHEVMKLVKQRGIAIELCPISNQVLRLVQDFRNHPGAVLINRGFNVVICNDDPAMWGAKGLSYDWYIVFMGLASINSDLRLLKQLAINSIEHSAMSTEEKIVAMLQWEKKWDEFLDKMMDYRYHNDGGV